MLEQIIHKWGGTEVTPMDVYKDMFRLGEGMIQKSGEASGEYKANPIAYWKNNKRSEGHFRIMFEDTFEETLQELQKADFAIINGITYFGRRNRQEHASKMYAMIFDLDGVTDKTLNNFFSGAFRAKAYPIPNYVILSGHGVHLYYIFEEPIPLFPNLKLQMKELKYALTERIWNPLTSKDKKPQIQGINQGFRVIGGKTKEGAAESKTRAFLVSTTPFTINQLNEFVPREKKIDDKKLFKESKLTLAAAKEKYPEWYEKVIVNKDRTPKKWDISGKVNGDNPYALYDWWKRKILEGASYHHRYFAIMCLAIYGVKCDVPIEKVEADAYELMPFLNELQPDDPFTETDIKSALECYDRRYCTFPIKDIITISSIPIEKNKRNGRKRSDHVRLMNFVRDEINGNSNWRDGNGRPSKKEQVKQWRLDNPEGTKAECIRKTGLSKPTVYKWWN